MTQRNSATPKESPSNDRPENRAFAALLRAQVRDDVEWPEPETSKLYNLLRKAALYIIFSVTHRKDPELARDTATKTLLKARMFRGETTFSSWFYRIAVNEAKMSLRNASRKREIQLDSVPEPPAPLVLGEASYEGLKLSPIEERMFEQLQSSGTRELFEELQEFAAKEKIHLRSARRVWQRVKSKLKSHLSS